MSDTLQAQGMMSDEATGGRRRAIVATVIGCGLEWFDFSVYNFFVVQISQLFFPSGSELTSILLTIATFGVGLVMRPIGGIVLGICGDRFGRKSVLSFTILVMAISTAIIGLAPTYAQAGIVSPIIIVIARVMQGFASGGEMGNATALLAESAPEGKEGFYSSWMQVSIGLAVLLGAATGVFVTALEPADMMSWGWRIPFLLGIIIGPVGYYIRRHVHETPAFEALGDQVKHTTPLQDVLRTYPRETFATFSMIVLFTVSTYVLLYYMPTYAIRTLHLPQSNGFVAGVVGGAVIMCLSPLAGTLADRYGRRLFAMGGSIAILLSVYPMFYWINVSPSLFSLLVFQIFFGVLYSIYAGPLLAAFAVLFPTKVFSTGLSVAYNFAVVIFGGFASFIITWLIAATGNTMSPALYVIGAALISVAGACAIPKARRAHRH
jgi:MHS family proline/betaine transporter-like MFS transporter